ncbi:hypothetical protein [Halobacillus mangrovi]|uniref:Uncharacterized protein n=1 Tax=Halobacillus mangrovi TaxID=402384 RepID=A0A1W5ZZP0_9BACI|nr:hypothetical protein [Halobacillus mangrovi]ARI78707.1 hypothetical protein HM131_18490 [Halobacillus mangrovi]
MNKNEQQLNRDAKICTRWAFGLTLIFIVIFPGVMFITGYNYSLSFFKGWTYLSFGWLIIAGFFIAFRPVVEFMKGSNDQL